MVFLFSISIFLSAFLLFLVQPMFAKMVLPLLGGSPAVWTTCMLFFQAALFAGYAYAHGAIRFLGVRRQAVLHIVLAALPIFLLPVGIAAGTRPPADTPVTWLMGLMATSVGAPFFVLATTAPLLQRWFSSTEHRSAADPYFLYAASNAGSLAALLLYPVAIEPFLSLRTQRYAWGVGYALTTILLLACAIRVSRSAQSTRGNAVDLPEVRLSVTDRLRWTALAFVPSGLMLAVTSHISTDVAAVPLLWIVPLALYLSTFIVAFSKRAERIVGLARRIFPIILLVLVLFLVGQVGAVLWFIIPVHLSSFWLLALLCHWRLASERPPPSHLTEFYLWLAVGGMLGGLFNLAAQRLFVSVAEYPILIAAGCFLLASYSDLRDVVRRPRALIRPLSAGLIAAVILVVGLRFRMEPGAMLPLLGLPAFVCFSMSKEPARFAIAITLLLAAGLVTTNRAWGDILYAERTFFGVYRITADAGTRFVSLFHGTTVHGRQALHGTKNNPQPLTYYHRGSPIADVFTRPDPGPIASVGVVGLGVGSLAAYAQAGQRWTFYEIDPAVERIARDHRYFTFLRACGDTCKVVLGDGRLTIAATAETHDVLILDAFSSDAIPVHLLTTEAIQTYLRRLREAGVLVFHVSNRHFDLQPVLGRLAADQQLLAVARFDHSDRQSEAGRNASRWVALSRNAESLKSLTAARGWVRVGAGTERPWTDDFTNVWSVLQWR